MRPKISVIVPFFYEEQNVVSLLAEIRAVCDGLGKRYEGIFVNDGSTDATGRRLDEVAKGWPEAKTFHFQSNHGQAAALYFGMKRAAGEILVTLDGDGQNDPANISGGGAGSSNASRSSSLSSNSAASSRSSS